MTLLRQAPFQERKIRSKNLIALLFLAVLPILIWLTFSSGNNKLVTLIGIAPWLVITGLLILQRWQRGIYLFFIWIVFEDLLRKFFGGSFLLFFAKDVLLGAIYISFMFSRRQRTGYENEFSNLIKIPLLAWIFLALVQSLNPTLAHPLVPVIGWRMMFFYLPLLYLGYAFLESEQKLRRLLGLAVGLGCLVALGGILQTILGIEFLNPGGLITEDGIRIVNQKFGGGAIFYRTNSVFLSGGRFGLFLLVTIFLTIGFVYYLRHPDVKSIAGNLLWVVLAILVVAFILNAVRAFIISLAILAIALLLRSPIATGTGDRPLGNWVKSTIIAISLFAFLVVLIKMFGYLYPEVTEPVLRFYEATLLPSSQDFAIIDTVQRHWRNISIAVLESSVFGHGTGSASQGLQYLSIYLYGTPYQLAATEGGYSAVIWEYGVLGLPVWLWWTTSLVIAEYKVFGRLRQTRFYVLALCICVWTFTILFPIFANSMQNFQNYVTAAYLWFWAGVLFKLPSLLDEERA